MYAGMAHYIDYLEAHSQDGLVVSDRPGEWCLGDWCTPDPIKLPPPYVNTYFKVKALDAMIKIDSILGRKENPAWRARREAACAAINGEIQKKGGNTVHSGSVTTYLQSPCVFMSELFALRAG